MKLIVKNSHSRLNIFVEQ